MNQSSESLTRLDEEALGLSRLINPINNGIFHNNFYCSTKGVEGAYRTGQTKCPTASSLTPSTPQLYYRFRL